MLQISTVFVLTATYEYTHSYEQYSTVMQATATCAHHIREIKDKATIAMMYVNIFHNARQLSSNLACAVTKVSLLDCFQRREK